MGNFFCHSLSEVTTLYLFFLFSCLIKWYFYENLGFILFFVLSFYWHLVCRYLITAFDLTSSCYDLMLFVVLLRRFICVGAIQIDKMDLISQIYQIMVVSILKK